MIFVDLVFVDRLKEATVLASTDYNLEHPNKNIIMVFWILFILTLSSLKIQFPHG